MDFLLFLWASLIFLASIPVAAFLFVANWGIKSPRQQVPLARLLTAVVAGLSAHWVALSPAFILFEALDNYIWDDLGFPDRLIPIALIWLLCYVIAAIMPGWLVWRISGITWAAWVVGIVGVFFVALRNFLWLGGY